MELKGFFDKAKNPEAGELAEMLGVALTLWNELRQSVAQQFSPLSEEWVFSGKSHGWALRLKQKKRAIMYLKPLAGGFRTSFAFGEKAVTAAHKSDLPESVLKLIDDAVVYPEGRGVRMDIHDREDVRLAIKLAEIKMAN